MLNDLGRHRHHDRGDYAGAPGDEQPGLNASCVPNAPRDQLRTREAAAA